VVPLTSVNVVEVSEVANVDRRERLSKFMVKMSRNHSLVDHQSVRKWELSVALSRECLNRESRIDVRPLLLRWGVGCATGIGGVTATDAPPALIALVNEALRHPQTSVRLLQVASEEGTKRGREVDEAWRAAAEDLRAETENFNEEDRIKYETGYNLSHGLIGQQVQEAAKDLGLDSGALEAWLGDPNNRLKLIRQTPSLSIEQRLRYVRDRNAQQPVDKNDLKDLAFLGLTICYANIVVTEKAWGHVANVSGVASAWSTVMLRSVTELVPHLVSFRTS